MVNRTKQNRMLLAEQMKEVSGLIEELEKEVTGIRKKELREEAKLISILSSYGVKIKKEQKIDDVKNNNVDVFVMGDDWKGKFDFLKDYCEVVYLPRTEGISTTKIKEDLGLHKGE